MGGKMKRVCSICARGGSQGVKGKNIRPLLGKPLIVYSIEHAQQSGLFDVIAVSSDSEEILSVAESAGVEYLVRRPAVLAQNTSPKVPVIIHCIEEVERTTHQHYDVIVDLDATSPLREVQDIMNVVSMLEEKRVTNVITGMPARRSPYFNLVEVNKKGVVQVSKPLPAAVTRRQDSPKCYDMNASIYAWTRDGLLKHRAVFNSDTLLYVMPAERSIDIDSELDFNFVEYIMTRNQIIKSLPDDN